MASLRVGLGQSNLKLNQLCCEDRCDGWWARAGTVKLAHGGRRLRRRLSVASGGGGDELVVTSDSNLSKSRLDHNVGVRKRRLDKEDAVSGKLDQWIRDYVGEIVSNIEEAPFLVHIYPGDDLESAKSTKTKMVREKAAENSWPNIKHRWERGSSIPNGIALVEELKIDDDDNVLPVHEEKSGTVGIDNLNCSATKVFGVVIQERGLTCPACYILKTSIVRSISGTCTHFCIFRADCFGETADMQLKKQWLL